MVVLYFFWRNLKRKKDKRSFFFFWCPFTYLSCIGFKKSRIVKYRFNKILLIQISFSLSKIKSKCKKDIMYKGRVLVLDIL